ncbi:lactose permease [Paraphoma chrysanthemicola]|uniref:Lactose permease n=1 Tax=Paraphoma chrysanthemicola TaxID=798071 RepID=A0A8K0VRQ2_9PLEO|nr:lactose permease [Paraphoma chrysanthemicola]
MSEKHDFVGAETERHITNDDDLQKSGNIKEANVASVALAAALEAQKPKLFSRSMIQLYGIMGVGYLVSTLNGFDSSLMGAINAMEAYQKTFNLTGAGESAGIVFIIYNLGQIAAFPFCGFLADGYGRRVCIFVGCLLVLVGTAVQSSAHEMGQFKGGRFILGFGASIASAAGPAYTVELAHPAYRGTMAGMYNNFWWLGNILAGWTTYGTNKNMADSSWAWRLPTVVQCILPSIVMAMIMFFPETPRWLLAKDRREEAIAIMAKYHGEGDPNSPIVQLQLQEITEDFSVTRNDNPWWDFRELVNTRGARYRLAMVICMAFFGQWSGNNVVSYFMPLMIKNAGITDPNKQLLINAINPIFSMIAAVYGATLLDKLGRRKMLMGGLWGGLGAYVLLTAFTATATETNNLAYGTIVSIYLFGIFFAWGWTPLQTLYAVECLENRTRAKGSGLNFLFLNIAMVVNTYGISIGIEKIQWKLYLVFIVWICVEIAVIYWFFVETAGKTLEELKEIFDAPNPRKASLKRAKVAMTEGGQVLDVKEA